MSRAVAVLRSRWVRIGFVAVALGAAVVAVVREREGIGRALAALPWTILVAALLVSVVYLVATMFSWRAVMADLGSPLSPRTATGIFFVSQLGKYVPGGVWNLVAAGELGADHRIPRRRSLSAMAVAVLISLVSGLAVAAPAIALSPGDVAARYRWAWLLLPVFLLVLTPPVLNRVLAVLLRVARREPLEHALTARGTARAAAWAVVGWLVAGLQVWLLAAALGLDRTVEGFALAAGAYALAWVVGFLVVVAPAGLGAREVVLGAILSAQVALADAVVLVVVSRLLLTLVDLAAAGIGLLVLRAPGKRERSVRA